jgi:hypothetical protein
MLNRKKKKSAVCVNCHFLRIQFGEKCELTLKSKDRDSIRKGNFDDVTENKFVFECYRGVWSEGYNGTEGFDKSKEARKKEINETPRKNFCFFWKYRPGMFLPAAEELQKRDYELEYARKDRCLTIWGLFIAAIALLANVIFNIIS